MTAGANPDTKLALFEAERALNCFVFHSNPRWKIYCVFVGILDGWLTKVKSLVPIDESFLIGKIYHNYVIDL
jgi:hypothetical protein